MPYDRDIGAFDARAGGYDRGWLGRLHRDIADKVIDLSLDLEAGPERVLDIGCGTGYLLRRLAARLPGAVELVGVDPASQMVEAATAGASDDRLTFQISAAEELPFADDRFDLVLATTSFDHWTDQQAGVGQAARVLKTSGHLVLADLFSRWMAPTVLVGRRGRARTVRRAGRLLEAAGLQVCSQHHLSVLIKAISARK